MKPKKSFLTSRNKYFTALKPLKGPFRDEGGKVDTGFEPENRGGGK